MWTYWKSNTSTLDGIELQNNSDRDLCGQHRRTYVCTHVLFKPLGGRKEDGFLHFGCFQLSLFAGPALWPWPHPDRRADQYSDGADAAQQDNQCQGGTAGTAGEERSCSWAQPPIASVGSQPLHFKLGPHSSVSAPPKVLSDLKRNDWFVC